MKSNSTKIPSAAKVVHNHLKRKLDRKYNKFSYENVKQEDWDNIFPKKDVIKDIARVLKQML